MCRYAAPYKPHLACFACRKSFKRRLLTDVEGGGPDRPARCPQCGGPMANMGLDFAPPKQRDVKAWQVVESLFEAGQTFHSCGCSGPGYRPRDRAALRAYYLRLLADFEHAAINVDPDTLPRVRVPNSAGGRPRWRTQTVDEVRAYWNDRARALRGALAALG
ncbi:MAG: hypothetical protein KC583_03080 [Myxococcales bacterium]|nr:hypothetical protein [Myxococcales bacterium]